MSGYGYEYTNYPTDDNNNNNNYHPDPTTTATGGGMYGGMYNVTNEHPTYGYQSHTTNFNYHDHPSSMQSLPGGGGIADHGMIMNPSNTGAGSGGQVILDDPQSSSVDGGEGEDDYVEDEEGGNTVDFDDPRIAALPRILLMGPRRAGKTSIQRVVFHKMSPHETLFRLEATQSLERSVVDHTPICRFTIWDFPGDYYGHEQGYPSTSSFSSYQNRFQNTILEQQQQQQQQQQFTRPSSSGEYPQHHLSYTHEQTQDPQQDHHHHQQPNSEIYDEDSRVFGRATALIFVLDAQDEPYDHVLQQFTETVKRAARANPHIAIEVFINKVDGELFLTDEAKYDCRRDVMQQVSDELADAGVMPDDSVPISYHLTSIYDHSIFEAFSKVVQKLIPQLPTIENLLNVLVSTCSMEKAYLFDVASKLYIGTDSSPADMQSVELCSDMIDVVLDVSGIYGSPMDDLNDDGVEEGGEGQNNEDVGNNADLHQQRNTNIGTSDLDHTGIEFANDGEDELVGTLISQGLGDGEKSESMNNEEDFDSAYDSKSESVIRLSKGMVLYLKEVDTMLALVCLTRAENFRKKSLIDYNIGCLKKALRSLPSPSDCS